MQGSGRRARLTRQSCVCTKEHITDHAVRWANLRNMEITKTNIFDYFLDAQFQNRLNGCVVGKTRTTVAVGAKVGSDLEGA